MGPHACPAANAFQPTLIERGAASLAFVENELGLRHDGGELAVAAGDARLQHQGGAAAMQRRADRPHGIAFLDAGKEVGLAFDRGGIL